MMMMMIGLPNLAAVPDMPLDNHLVLASHVGLAASGQHFMSLVTLPHVSNLQPTDCAASLQN